MFNHKKRKLFLRLLGISFLSIFLIGWSTTFLLANGNNTGNNTGVSITNPLRADTFTDLFVLIANWVAGIVATFAILAVMIGGVQYMASGGNEKKMESARKTVQWAVIGLIIVLLSWSLLVELQEILGVKEPVKPATDLPETKIKSVIVNAINWLVGIVATASVFIVMVSGTLWLTAGGDEERVKSSRRWLVGGVVGLIIALGAWAIVRVVTESLFPKIINV